MPKNKSESWDERYKRGDAPRGEDPSDLLLKWISNLPRGKALDVACGAGRNSLFLAENGYDVDAIDYSEEALKIAKERAEDRGLEVNWILADFSKLDLPEDEYNVINVSFYQVEDRWQDLKDALDFGGYIVYEHHINSAQDVEHGPKSPRFRFDPNELLNNFIDFHVLYYQEGIEKKKGRPKMAKVRLVARKTECPDSNLPAI